mmetsp:Transcript_29921/g.45901  ORF Transcript_29921/g.45901 Transcript_29921/m.45901 type:complete len:410 (-) Transcript_29921:49-1278(-)|eukprot:CAMPEP_0195293696 /NCGR_PEP_ID=MMETSP0707-20130614/13143_1 /TAXON_ID=33640 /ORGANISM="Asterionellopsis glacialis, Strain CCMP134" /LENGTH=409 /DNA_ID=CAMNT_0040354467 /DNA_START=165 /DNA_END=1394 /DNA_ORIENTATION=+
MKERTAGFTATIPYLGPWWSALLHSSTMNRGRPIDRALGAGAVVGLSYVLLRLVSHALKSPSGGSRLYPLIQTLVKGVMPRNKEEEGTRESDSKPIKHTGSCHCGIIEIELMAPKNFEASSPRGKIRYPRYRTAATNFRFSMGTEYVQMYYDAPENSLVAAHAFCTKCGVHILHAPDRSANLLDINVDCLDRESKRSTSEKLLREDTTSGLTQEEGDWQDSITDSEEGGKREELSHSALNDDVRQTIFPNEGGKSRQLRSQSIEEHSAIPETAPSMHLLTVAEPEVTKHFSHPGTPSTDTTAGTGSVVDQMRMKALVLETRSTFDPEAMVGGDHLSVSSSITTGTAPAAMMSQNTSTLPRLRTLLPPSSANPSPSSISSTPLVRDQLKYYMKKHLNNPPSTSSGNKVTK